MTTEKFVLLVSQMLKAQNELSALKKPPKFMRDKSAIKRKKREATDLKNKVIEEIYNILYPLDQTFSE